MGNAQTLSIAGHSIRIKAPLAEGGQASVFMAEDELRRKYALKVGRAPKDEPSMNHVHEMESEMHEAVPPHPNVVQLVGSKIDTTTDTVFNVYYLLLEYCPRSVQVMLEQVAKKKEAMPERDMLNVFISAASALKHLHAHRIAHRDMKVENLLVGSDGTVKLCDFGSCSTDHRVLRNGTEVCYAKEDIEKHTTLAYRAPEQVDLYSGKCVCEKVDIWALGVLLFKLCFFRTPFEDKAGAVSNMAIMNGRFKIPTGMTYSEHRGVGTLLRYLLNTDPDARPTAAQVLDKVQQLMDAGDLLRVDDATVTTAAMIARSPVFSSTPRSAEAGTPPGPGTPRGGVMSPSQRRSLGLGVDLGGFLSGGAGTIIGGDRGGGLGGSMGKSFGSTQGGSFLKYNEDGVLELASPVEDQPDVSTLATVNRAARPADGDTGRPKTGTFATGTFGMLGLMGSKGKRSWIVKATSKEGGAPKAKYVRRIILSVWEEKMSPQSFFMLLYQRPVTTNPVVALKGLITTLKVMQQGPMSFLGEAASCVGMLDEIGKHWGNMSTKMIASPNIEHGAEGYSTLPHNNTMLPVSSPSHSRCYLDVASVDLVSRMAHLLVVKLHFHEQHPDFAVHFTAIPTMLGYDSVPVTGEVQDINALSRLLTIQDTIISTQRLIFNAQNENVQTTARWALLPLIEEAYTVFVACTFLLASLLELAARTQGLEHSKTMKPAMVSWKQHVTVLLALREQYETQLTALQTFYRLAESVPEVKSMKRVPLMPAAVPVALDGALNWRPLTMKSPMVRLSGMLDERARINDEMDQLAQERSHRTASKSQVEHYQPPALHGDEAKGGGGLGMIGQEDKAAVPQHRPKPTAKQGWESFGGSVFPALSTLEIETKQVSPQETRSDQWFFPSAVSDQGGFLEAISAARGGQKSENTSPSTSSHGALEDFLTGTGGRGKPPSHHTSHHSGGAAGGEVAITTTTTTAISSTAGPNVGNEVNDVWADFFVKNPTVEGKKPSSGGGGGGVDDGPKVGSIKKEISVDLLAWSSSSELDSEEDSDDDEGDEEVVAYTTKNMGDFLMASAMGHSKEDVLASIKSVLPPPTPTAPAPAPAPPPPLGPLTAVVVAPSPPVVEDSKSRARKKEARSQPWRQNLKPNVAQALAACIRDFEQSGLVFPFDQIVVGGVIGHGAFATVYRGTCMQGTDVAIKKLMTQNHLPMAEKSVRDFNSEVALLRQLHHPNIISLVGTCTDPVALLTEFCHKGNLFCILNDQSKYDLTWERKLSIACGLADGMDYLHTRDPILIHRDLKSLNVLLNRDWVVKITDFGLSRFKPHSLSDIMTMQCGTYHWMAPEVINSTRYTEKADVYSFGIILWEIFTRSIPYEGLQPVQVVAAVINRGERPLLPPDCPTDYATMAKACWSHDPANRPAFSEIAPQLHTMLSELSTAP